VIITLSKKSTTDGFSSITPKVNHILIGKSNVFLVNNTVFLAKIRFLEDTETN